MAASPHVTVLVNCRNGEAYLVEALNSIFAQTYTDWEIVFWDNLSTDGSAAIARSYGPRLRYFRGRQSVGLGAARGLALARARGEFVALLDADDIWLPRQLATLVPMLGNNPDLALVWGYAYRIDSRRQLLGRYSDRFQFRRGRCFGPIFHDGYIGPSSNMVMRRAAVDAVGGYRSDLSICADLDVFYRLAHAWAVDFSPLPTAVYRHHGENSSHNLSSLIREEKALLRYWSAHPPPARCPPG